MTRPRGLARKRAGLPSTDTLLRAATRSDNFPGVQRAGALGALPVGSVWRVNLRKGKEQKNTSRITGGQGDIKRLELTI
ncbi:hypothetical protein A3844_20030 [Paenibacillus helianthi]|uniref:Uncharacterized protein n=1 Tax=Paenibacillus helianthi TaxID=1349432 RepID=A0ABX3EMA0_9BACL|nr:hypothetical protein A3844_20030 [Paenibacillus helianthi]